ncbi:hypothetical protein TNCV_3536401 [Trichonephila clavipes]|uniref:Uncharacterized protein n=1 Tax=Trichonephila clavipes TaxID=2585209 RepID=A0A8X6VWU9_TRICX|nr:hypothetical protein TNCV_3536401 [Trichonephila clavipes]
MDKLDEDKLLEQCEELIDQHPGQDKPNESLEPMDKPNESLEPMDKSNESLAKSNEPLESKPLEPELMDKSNETLEPELMDKSNETLEPELRDHCLMDTANEEKPLEPMNKSNEEKPLDHCDGERCHEAVYKSLEYCPTVSLDELLDYVDKPMVENTSKEFVVETMERLDEAMKCSDLESMEEVMKCSDLDIVAMECCEEFLHRNANYYKDVRNVTEALLQELGNIYVQEWQGKDWTIVANEQLARLINNKT